MLRDAQHPWLATLRAAVPHPMREADAARMERMMRHHLRQFTPLALGSRVLDVACGTGCTMVGLRRAGMRVVGIDHDETVLEAARENLTRWASDAATVRGDMMAMAAHFGPDSFDACYLGGVLNHINTERARTLVDAMLTVAPIAMIDVVMGAGDGRHARLRARMDSMGITTTYLSEARMRSICSGYATLRFVVGRGPSIFGMCDQIFVTLARENLTRTSEKPYKSQNI